MAPPTCCQHCATPTAAGGLMRTGWGHWPISVACDIPPVAPQQGASGGAEQRSVATILQKKNLRPTRGLPTKVAYQLASYRLQLVGGGFLGPARARVCSLISLNSTSLVPAPLLVAAVVLSAAHAAKCPLSRSLATQPGPAPPCGTPNTTAPSELS